MIDSVSKETPKFKGKSPAKTKVNSEKKSVKEPSVDYSESHISSDSSDRSLGSDDSLV